MKDERNNSGYRNSGNWNSGHWNSGNLNSGHWNSGNSNSGDWNSGNLNSGDWNSGHWNSGNLNSGDWNSCNRETGFFNTIESKTIRVFNKECLLEVWEAAEKPDFIYFDLQKWISYDEMTEKEKEDNPSHETTGGYLKTYDYKEAFQESYKNATKEDKELLLKLPNFDADVFYDISGIDVREDDKSSEINDIKAEIEKLQERLNKLEK